MDVFFFLLCLLTRIEGMRARRVGHGGAAAGRREQHLGGEFGSGDRHGWRAEELTWGEPTDERTFKKRNAVSNEKKMF